MRVGSMRMGFFNLKNCDDFINKNSWLICLNIYKNNHKTKIIINSGTGILNIVKNEKGNLFVFFGCHDYGFLLKSW